MVHKIVLETFSPIFKKMIEAQSSDNENVIEITDCDYQLVQNAVNFCYGMSEAIPTNCDDLILMLKFSNKYEIDDLKKEIEFKLMSKILPENVCKFTNVAIEANAENLKAMFSQNTNPDR
uniref:BTB domain-containing protein n=1 Tax=Panagrolaimus sp. ES5 TaxID=591445 RepID=A0AC34FR40_9BILA